MESLNTKIYNLHNQEISDLMIGYNFNKVRLAKLMDLIASEICKQPFITELFE